VLPGVQVLRAQILGVNSWPSILLTGQPGAPEAAPFATNVAAHLRVFLGDVDPGITDMHNCHDEQPSSELD
jgi:hypothetical protein